MFGWAITFLIIAIIAGILGFGGVAGTAFAAAKIVFIVAIIAFSSPLSWATGARRALSRAVPFPCRSSGVLSPAIEEQRLADRGSDRIGIERL